uniref:angiopoietin-4 isoform X1 n=1 Tax=Panthera onca TaxID=9690 RepID=UPI0029550FFF|nr:angiopoietin-4 isoform X1 [Panthera onca]
MLPRPAMLLGGLLLAAAAVTAAQRRGQEAAGRRRAHRVQHGQCSYTFVLPEPEPCPPEPEAFGGSNSLQRDSPAAAALNLGDWPAQRVRQLEKVLENNTQWLQKLERYIQMNLRSELAQVQQHMVQNQTATMLELGTSLLNQTTAQTRKLTDVEAQVLNQTSRMEIQLLETSLSTNKLEKQLLLQGHELHRLQGRNKQRNWHLRLISSWFRAEWRKTVKVRVLEEAKPTQPPPSVQGEILQCYSCSHAGHNKDLRLIRVSLICVQLMLVCPPSYSYSATPRWGRPGTGTV